MLKMRDGTELITLLCPLVSISATSIVKGKKKTPHTNRSGLIYLKYSAAYLMFPKFRFFLFYIILLRSSQKKKML